MGEKGEMTLGGTPRVAQPDRFFVLESEEMIRRGELREAIEHCRRGLIFYPENISGYAVLANASLLLEETGRAVNVLLDGYRRTGASELKDLADALTTPSPSLEIETPVTEEITLEEDATNVTDDSSASETFAMEELHITDIVPGINEEDEEGGVWSITDDEVPTGREVVEETAAEGTSLFEEEVEPVTRDLFTGEPLDDGPLSFRVETYEEEYDDDEAREKTEVDEEGKGRSKVAPKSLFKSDEPEEKSVERVEDRIPASTPRSVEEIVDAVEDVEEKSSAGEPGEREEEGAPANPLSLHSGTPISKLRSRNLRLIPGLEYAPLRKDDTSPKFAPLVEDRSAPGSIPMPPLQTRTTPPETSSPVPKPESGSDARKKSVAAISGDSGDESMTPLEELARRLESARIPAVEEAKEIAEDAPAFEPSLVSDTFAAILVSQGAYAEAIKAYQMLARLKPDRREEYEKKIAEVKWSMGNVTDA